MWQDVLIKFYSTASLKIVDVHTGAWDPKTCSIDDVYNMAVACAELGSREPTTQIAGGISILDMKDTSLRHVTQLSPAYAKKIIDWAQVRLRVLKCDQQTTDVCLF